MQFVSKASVIFIVAAASLHGAAGQTTVTIHDDAFHINGRPTYEGVAWNGRRIEGLLLNARLVQGVFDDHNPETADNWAYPDTGEWSAERNVAEFIAAMPHWRQHGLLAFTLNLQGGCPYGYCNDQPWINSAIASDGQLVDSHMERVERILDRADELGMVVILGLYYFGQDQRLSDEAAVIRGVDNVTGWLLDRGYRNVLVEINNECDLKYDHEILQPARVHELIARVQAQTRDGYHLPAGTSFSGGTVPTENVVRQSDFILLHGNGVNKPQRIREMVSATRQVPGYQPMPILFNEDDHFAFTSEDNNFSAALDGYASWGFFDPGQGDYQNGFQSPPVDWQLNTPRKRAFFCKVSEITASAVDPSVVDDCCAPDMLQAEEAARITPPMCGAGAIPAGLGAAALMSFFIGLRRRR